MRNRHNRRNKSLIYFPSRVRMIFVLLFHQFKGIINVSLLYKTNCSTLLNIRVRFSSLFSIRITVKLLANSLIVDSQRVSLLIWPFRASLSGRKNACKRSYVGCAFSYPHKGIILSLETLNHKQLSQNMVTIFVTMGDQYSAPAS